MSPTSFGVPWQNFPDRTAIADLEQTLTYSELDLVINRVARGLLDLGVETQGFVAILSGNRVETLETYLGCARAGLIAVPINPMIAPAELEHILSETTPKVVVTSAASLGEAGPADRCLHECHESFCRR